MSEDLRDTSADRGRQNLVRGSSLLLTGRVLSKFVNLGVQVGIVRLLTKDDFGAFAYGLALILAGEVIVKFGLGRGANRFVPYYAERGDHAEVMGTLALVCTTILGLGVIGFAGLVLVSGMGLGGFPTGEGGEVVLILALLAPIQALDTICIQTLACFSRPRAIFFRKHVLGPGLRAAAVIAVFAVGGNSKQLALAYLAGGVIGLLIAVRLTIQQLHLDGILPLPISRWRVPWRPLIRFSFPLITSDLVYITLTGLTTVVLMKTDGEAGVATMRAVVPAAALNALVVQSFAILFTPGAMRLHAQGDDEALREQHWQSAAWVAVLSFPIFALTFGVAPVVVPLLFGEAYAESAPLLALLAIGHYMGVCLAFNSETLEVLGRTRALVCTNLLMISLGAGLVWVLCPIHGPLGAAVAVTCVRMVGALVRHFVLRQTPEFRRVPKAHRVIWFKIACAGAGAAALGWLWQPPLAAQVLGLAAISILLLRSTAHSLDIRQSFPEVLRIPLLARVVGA